MKIVCAPESFDFTTAVADLSVVLSVRQKTLKRARSAMGFLLRSEGHD